MQLKYPWFLLGLLAVAVPIIIHLLQLRRPRRLLFTNTSFMRETELVVARHRKIQRLLVLLARILTIGALVIVFSQPFIPTMTNSKSGGGSGLDVLIDNSYSMQRTSIVKGSLFQEGLTSAEKLDLLNVKGSSIRLINPKNSGDKKEDYQTALANLKLSVHNSFSIVSHNRVNNKENKNALYVLSDFQKTALNEKFLEQFGAERQMVLVPLVGPPVENVYVDSVWLDDAFVRLRTNVGLRVRVRNGGNKVVRDCPVKVFLGSKQVSAFRVTVAAGQANTSVVQIQVADQDMALGRVVTEDSPVTFDNTYYFTLRPAAAVRVLEIGEEPLTQGLYRNEPLFTYSFTTPRRLDYAVLRRADLVLLREVGQVDAGLRAGLQTVVQRGGSVTIVPSALALGHESYRQLFREMGLGAVQWETNTGVPELREVAMPSAQELFFRNVFGAQPRVVTMPRVAPVLRWARTGTDILRLRDGESYLANFASGAGQVYVFSAPFAKEYSDFLAHALFVPVMYRMAMLSSHREQPLSYRLTQETVGLELPDTTPGEAMSGERGDEANLRLVRDSLTLIPVQRVQGREVRLDVPKSLDVPGFYQVQRRGKVLTTMAFNQNKQESELAPYGADELRELIGPNRPNIRVLESGVDGTGLVKIQAEQTGQPLWRYFLAVALAALLAETLLVRFGSRGVGVARGKA